MYRRALAEARRVSDLAADVYRYFSANQYLVFGDPSDALSEAERVPAGAGHVQCVLHSVCAEALWKMGRQDEARAAAQRAMDTAPTAERRADTERDLAHILNAG
jgi:predicted RNA polymerase sigma factor